MQSNFNHSINVPNQQANASRSRAEIDHSEVVLDTAKGHAKTVQQLMWHESVLELLINS